MGFQVPIQPFTFVPMLWMCKGEVKIVVTLCRRSIVEMEKQRLLDPANGLDVGFDVDSISLWWTEADDRSLTSWKKLEDFNLQGSDE